MSDKLNLDEIEARAQEVMAERSIHGGIPRNSSLARMTLLAADVQALLAERERLVGIINETIVACYENKLDETAQAIKARLDGAPA